MATTIATYKNMSLENVTFPANAAVLVKERETPNGNIIEALIIDGVKDTKPVTLVKHLLITMLADFQWRNQFEADYKEVKDESGKVVASDSGVRAKNMFTKFLAVGVICKTDADGKLSHALKCDEGMTLKATALAVRKNHALVQASDANTRRACIHNQAKAIVAQCTQFTGITKVAKAIADDMEAIEAAKKSKKSGKEAA